MNALDATEQVLKSAGKPLHYKEITRRILEEKLWQTEGKTPEYTINAQLAVDIKERGGTSRFVRVDRGVFGLSQPPDDRGRPPSSNGKQRGKLSIKDVQSLALEVIRGSPEGIRYSELVSEIMNQSPLTPRNTIQGAVWNLDALFPNQVIKPSRGIFTPKDSDKARDEQSPEAQPRIPESTFYEPFADWLKNDLGEATDAVAFGGASMRTKWGTPDVIGVYKPRASDRVKFDIEIISAEIKVDPATPVVAFGQAVAYRLFSTRTYVVMPKTIGQEDLERLEALCSLFGVGLVLFSLDAERPDFSIRMRAQRFYPDMYYVNEFADSLHRHSRDVFDRVFQ